MDTKNCCRFEGENRTECFETQAKERLMARIRIAECERAVGASRDAFEALAELETELGLA